MYRIDVIAVGKVRDGFLLQGMAEYQKRMAPYAQLRIIEVKEEKGRKTGPEARKEALRLEGERIRERIDPGAHVIALDRKGTAYTSPGFSRYLEGLAEKGRGRIAFVVGGSLGLEPRLLEEADRVMSFSHLTFPHQLFRLLLLEQLYRAFSIMKGHPYHK